MTRVANFPLPTVKIACRKCPRAGSYTRERFAALVGPNTTLPDALAKIAADCPKRCNHSYGADTCGAIYADLLALWRRSEKSRATSDDSAAR